ncbi:MAG TPA: hypothetical protein VGJ98_05515 [Candidatus Eisenbacteria bacterium]|jgi:hypothetical protein
MRHQKSSREKFAIDRSFRPRGRGQKLKIQDGEATIYVWLDVKQ